MLKIRVYTSFLGLALTFGELVFRGRVSVHTVARGFCALWVRAALPKGRQASLGQVERLLAWCAGYQAPSPRIGTLIVSREDATYPLPPLLPLLS